MAQGAGERSPINVTHHLKGIKFPATRDDLMEQARENKADADVLDKIEQMPEQEYETMADVMKGYGKTD